MSKRIHILLLPSWYPTNSSDIRGSFFREQALALQKQGVQIGVIAPIKRSLRNSPLKLLMSPHGLKVTNDYGINTYRWYSINYTSRLTKLNRKRWINTGEKIFKKYITCNGIPDLIHVHSMLDSGFLALKLAKEYNIPYVITEHSTAYSRNIVKDQTLKELLPVALNSQANLAVSNEFAKLLNTIFKTDTWDYLPNIVNDKFFQGEASTNKTGNSFEFITVCSLEQKKRVDILIKAFAESFSGNQKFKLKIGGDGTLRRELEKLVHDSGITSQVTFLGRLSRDDVKNRMKETNVFVLPSEYETFGVVVIEALALGKPVIATKCGGPESIVTPDVGLLIEKNSIKDMSKAMKYIANNYKNYDSAIIRDYCNENFSETAVAIKLKNIYRKILQGNHA